MAGYADSNDVNTYLKKMLNAVSTAAARDSFIGRDSQKERRKKIKKNFGGGAGIHPGSYPDFIAGGLGENIKQTKKDFLKEELPLGAKEVSLSTMFRSPVEKPYIGLLIKTKEDLWGVIIDVFERNEDYLFDIEYKDGEVDKNLSWDRNYKMAIGDLNNDFPKLGEQRHKTEVVPLISRVMEKYGLTPKTQN